MDQLPIRRLNRLGNEAHLAANVATCALGNGRYELGIVALVLLSRCAGDWTRDETICQPKALSACMPVNAIARSLNAPYATIHRYTAALVEQGIATRTDAGFAINNSTNNSTKVIRYLEDSHDQFLKLIHDLIAVVGRPDSKSNPSKIGVREIVRGSLDTWLMPFEFSRQPAPDWTAKLVLVAVVVANVRHITTNDILNKRYAFDPVPDELRVPIRTSQLSRITGLAYGTTFRTCRNLAKDGVIRNQGHGWIFGVSTFQNRDIDNGVRAMASYYLKKIGEIAALCFDFSDIESGYIRGRPAYTAL